MYEEEDEEYGIGSGERDAGDDIDCLGDTYRVRRLLLPDLNETRLSDVMVVSFAMSVGSFADSCAVTEQKPATTDDHETRERETEKSFDENSRIFSLLNLSQ